MDNRTRYVINTTTGKFAYIDVLDVVQSNDLIGGVEIPINETASIKNGKPYSDVGKIIIDANKNNGAGGHSDIFNDFDTPTITSGLDAVGVENYKYIPSTFIEVSNIFKKSCCK